RVRQALRHRREDVSGVRVRDEPDPEHAVGHVPVLDVERPVEAPRVADVGDVLVIGILACDPYGGVAARHDDEDDERDERHGDADEDRPEDPPDEERHHQCSIFTFARGSSASRRPSPKMFSDSTVMTIARPGASASAGRVTIRSCPSAISLPHDGVGSCTPAPRNESPASNTMLLAMISVKKTSTELMMFGKSSVNMIRNGPAPPAIDAS